jgi:hypothetical protein
MKQGLFFCAWLSLLLAGCASFNDAQREQASRQTVSVPGPGGGAAPMAQPGPGSAAAASEVGAGAGMMGGAPSPMMGGSAAGAVGSGRGNAEAMCELQRRITAARTPEERQALMERYLPGMSQSMQERHLARMQQLCNGQPDARTPDTR